MNTYKHILVAPLNWGLGHATRCVPIINALLENNYKVTIASDGQALELLTKEFPSLPTVKLPSYNITYADSAAHFKKSLVKSLPKIMKAISAEHKALDALIDPLKIDGVISDNRLGLYTNKVPTVYISHQLNVLTSKTTWLSTYFHRSFMERFDECWVPDIEDDNNLSGILGHPKKGLAIPTKYIGILSRMKPTSSTITYKAIAIVSGPEPQRSFLRNLLLRELSKLNGKSLLVEGNVKGVEKIYQKGNLTIANYLTSQHLEKAINESEFVIARSGYTTIMDVAHLQKKAIFIPTPGQYEQEYLAARLKELRIAPFKTQEEFKIKDLAAAKIYKGFTRDYPLEDLNQYFRLFQSERKLRSHSKFTFNVNFLFMSLYNMFNNRETQS